jgi:hypothetical protein
MRYRNETSWHNGRPGGLHGKRIGRKLNFKIEFTRIVFTKQCFSIGTVGRWTRNNNNIKHILYRYWFVYVVCAGD